MVNRKDERVIYIKDLLFAVLYRWRRILIIFLILALPLGCYRGISLKKSSTSSDGLEESREDYAQQKQSLELEIANLEDRIESVSTYIANSPYMTLNPHRVYANELHVYLAPDEAGSVLSEGDSDPADTLLGAYRTLLLSNDTLDAIATELNMEGKNMEVIVDVNCDQVANLLTFVVRQADQENSEAVLEIMQTAIDDAQTSVTDIVGSHQASVLSSSVTMRNDTELAQLQNKKNEELSKLKESLKSRMADKSALVVPTATPISTQEIVVAAVKFALLGGLLGFLATCVMLILIHLARNKVYSRRTLEDHTGLHVLGCIPAAKKRSCFDRCLRRLEGRCVGSREHQAALITANIRNLSGEDGVLLLSGAGSAQDRLPLLDALKAAGCNVIASGDLLRDPETVNALGHCTGVVLVEQCGRSRYAWVEEAAAQAKAIGKPVLGCVLIDG